MQQQQQQLYDCLPLPRPVISAAERSVLCGKIGSCVGERGRGRSNRAAAALLLSLRIAACCMQQQQQHVHFKVFLARDVLRNRAIDLPVRVGPFRCTLQAGQPLAVLSQTQSLRADWASDGPTAQHSGGRSGVQSLPVTVDPEKKPLIFRLCVKC